MRLHLHAPGVEPDERVGEHAGEHKRIEAANPSHVCVGTATIRAVHGADEALRCSHDDRVPCLQLLPGAPPPPTSAARLAALGPRDQHVLEVLAGAAARAPVDVATQTPVEA